MVWLSTSSNPSSPLTPPTVADFWAEILAQPACWQALEAHYQSHTSIPLGFIPQRVVCFGEGSSLHALRMAAPLLQQAFGCPVTCVQPHEVLEHLALPHQPTTLWLTASQSGKTHSVLQVLDVLANTKASSYGTWVAFTNNSASPIAQHPSLSQSLPVLAGFEACIPATKSVSCCYVSIALWAQSLSPSGINSISHSLSNTSEWLNTLSLPTLSQTLLSDSASPQPAVLIGSACWQPLLDELALKWTETRSQPVVVYETEAFHHGPRALAASSTPLNFWCWGDLTEPALQTTFQWLNTHAHHHHTLHGVHLHEVQAKLNTSILALPSRFQTLSLPFQTPLEGLLKGLLLAQGLTASYCQLENHPINHPLLQKFLAPKTVL